MTRQRNPIFGQFLLLCALFAVFVVSVAMIFLAATVFRSQIPFFQLLDNAPSVAVETGPKPATLPGVTELYVPPTTKLYMVMGSDYRPQAGYRTDTIILIAVDSLSGKVSLVSFPRDLWVTIPGYYEQRINTVMQVGGFPLMANTMQANFGIYPREYAMIDMDGFLRVIDVLGGVTFETDYYTADRCERYLEPGGWCEAGPGTVSFDADWALWYVRARYNSSDFDRMRRTQEVMGAVMKKVMSPAGMVKMPMLMSIYESEVESNISPDDLLPLIRVAFGLNTSEDVKSYVIGPNEVTSWTTSEGASVLLPNTAAIQALLQSALLFE